MSYPMSRYVWENAAGDVIGNGTAEEIETQLSKHTGSEWTFRDGTQDESGEWSDPTWCCGTLVLALGDHYHEKPWSLSGATGHYMEGGGWHPLTTLSEYLETARAMAEQVEKEIEVLSAGEATSAALVASMLDDARGR